MKALQTTLLTAIIVTGMTACTNEQNIVTPATKKVMNASKQAVTPTMQPIELYRLLGWVENECGEGIEDENSALGKSRQAYFQFTQSPKSNKYSAFVDNVTIKGKRGILSMQDNRTTTIKLKNATYRGLPLNKIVIEEGYEFYQETFFFGSGANISSLKPYFKTSYDITKFNSSNNSITCESMMM